MNGKTLLIAVFSLFLVIFNAIFYLCGGTDREMGVWISYLLIHISWVIVLVMMLKTLHKDKMTELTAPSMLLSGIYFCLSFIVGIVFIISSVLSVKWCMIIQLILLGMYLLVFLSNAAVDNRTSQKAELQYAERVYVKKCSASLKSIMDKVNDKQIYKQIENVYDVIHASPVKSDEKVIEYEMEVFRLVRDLDRYVEEKNIKEINKTIDKILKNASTRNRLLSSHF